MKHRLAGMLALALLAGLLFGCRSGTAETEAAPPEHVRIGVALIDAEDAAESEAQRAGIEQALEALAMDGGEVVWRFGTGEEQGLFEALQACADEGCNLIFTNPHGGHQRSVERAAKKNPQAEFVAVGGDSAKASGLSNLHNASPRLFEAQYVAGIAAGLKLGGLIERGETEQDAQLGYIAPFPDAEAISGYTAYFLGARSVCPGLTMTVRYLNTWKSATAEYEAACELLDEGCIVIAGGTAGGAAEACREKRDSGIPALCAQELNEARAQWSVLYEELIDAFRTGRTLPTDWSGGFDRDAVMLTQIGEAAEAGTADAQSAAAAALRDGTLQVFRTDSFTVGGQTVTSALVTDTDGDLMPDCDEAISDGAFCECFFRSAPYFTLRVDGITERFGS